MDTKFEVRQSKIAVALGIISVFLFETVWGGLFIFAMYRLVALAPNYKTGDELFGDIFSLCFSAILFVVFIIILAYIVYCYKNEVDVYTSDRMYHIKGNKIIYELDYKDIVTVREWLMDTFIIFCEKPIILKNGKTGTKTVWAHYKKKDRYSIKQLIAEKCPNINIL